MPKTSVKITNTTLKAILTRAIITVLLFTCLCCDSSRLQLTKAGKDCHPALGVLGGTTDVDLPVKLRRAIVYKTRVVAAMVITPLNVFTVTTGSFTIATRDLYCVPNCNVTRTTAALMKRDVKTTQHGLTRHFTRVAICLNVTVVKTVNMIVCVTTPRVVNMVAPMRRVHRLKAVTLHVRTFTRPVFTTSVVTCNMFIKTKGALIPDLVGFFDV